ncbi:uncharacterized protein [Drosophila takahashii]|uniref:uncharacterized protein n=1 Tax=Drosophila takahashii TaxID=29030 RepID=UPI001CF8CB95|nr:uncharacterized protein LOC108064727 [Drosophila takahashii]
MERSRRIHIMMNQSFLSRATVTESMAQLAILNVDSSDTVEDTVVKTLLVVENKFRSYFESYSKEMELQRIAAHSLNQLIYRYQATTQVDTSCRCPKFYEAETEETMVTKYQLDYQVILRSNQNQCSDIHRLRPYVLFFRRECAKLDLNEESPFIQGDAFHKPIKFFIDLIEELFSYFYSGHLQLDSAANLLDPFDLNSVEYYQKLLTHNEDFDEYFMHNISFCKCLRVPPKCPSIEDIQLIRDQSEPYIEEAKRKRCARRFDKMAATELPCHEPDQKKSIPRVHNQESIPEEGDSDPGIPSHQHLDPRLIASEIDRFMRASAEDPSAEPGSVLEPN